MKLMTKKRAGKIVLGQVALLVALVVTQIGMQFATSYKWVGFQKVDGKDSWFSIAQTAQAANSLCSIQLDKANSDLEDFRKLRNSENSDIK